MTKVAILPVSTEKGDVSFRAVAGDKRSQGNTAGEALDALTPQLPNDATSLLVVIQSLRPDHFFTADQQQRLTELMTRWHTANDNGIALPQDEKAELDTLVEAELQGSASRAAALADEMRR